MILRETIYCNEVEEDVVVDFEKLDDGYREWACSQNDDHHCAYKLDKRCTVLDDFFSSFEKEI